MFKLGIYDEDEAKDIADYLRDAGIKVDIRTFIQSSLNVFSYIEGRRSELKEEVDDFETYDGYLKALAEVLKKGATAESFRDMLTLELDPKSDEMKKQIREILEKRSTEEDLDLDDPVYLNYIKSIAEIATAEEFIENVIKRNEIEIGEEAGARLDDPILRIPVDMEDYEAGHPLARTTVEVSLFPMAEVNLDLLSVAQMNELDAEFQDEFPDESITIAALGMLLIDLVENPSKDKIDMEAFSERCDLETEENGNIISIEGFHAADELARVLEKKGIIKIKDDMIKWKR